MSTPSTAAVEPGSLAAWRVALRPKTFPIAAVPVFVGTAFAWAQHGTFVPWVFVLAIAGAILVQAISNMQNDVGYTVRGGETGTRTGLPRATANGWLSVPAVRGAIVAAVVAALLVGAPLMVYRGWPVALIVASSIVAAWAYMGGPKPIAYTPLGDVTVFLFFGLMAVCGTIYVQAGTIGTAGWLAGVAIGLLAASVLTVNNHRDISARRDDGTAHAVGGAGCRRFASRLPHERARRVRDRPDHRLDRRLGLVPAAARAAAAGARTARGVRRGTRRARVHSAPVPHRDPRGRVRHLAHGGRPALEARLIP